MPPPKPTTAPSSCLHTNLQLDPSPFAPLAGFKRLQVRQRLVATIPSGRSPPVVSDKEDKEKSRTFPAPLVLPHDDLNYDPDQDAQSLKSWISAKHRNKVTSERKTIYVVDYPEVDAGVGFMKAWLRPDSSKKKERSKPGNGDASVEIPEADNVDAREEAIPRPDVGEITEYLRAFYHGMDVKPLSFPLRWTTWTETNRPTKRPRKAHAVPPYVALQYGNHITRVRARPAPDGVFPAQLNLDDILDAAMEFLPSDAYAIVLMVENDIYESEEDDFCCGRAYGGSRVCVVQTARYNPLLDARDGVDVSHAWPMSHCKTYVDSLCAVEDVVPKRPSSEQVRLSGPGPVRAAIHAASSVPTTGSNEEQQALWLARVARTASHELGHCMGMDHCVYYACNMQGTGSIAEDVRQPPYLCPVCEAKVCWAVAGELEAGKSERERMKWVVERLGALDGFCGGGGRDEFGMWRGLAAWGRVRLEGLGDGNEEEVVG